MEKQKVGIVGVGGIGLAYSAWIAERGHDMQAWAPRGGADVLWQEPLVATGVLESSQRIGLASSMQELVQWASVIVIAVPANAHRSVMDAMLPYLASGQKVIVSSMASLSSLYLYEQTRQRGVDVLVGSFGTTALTARRKAPAHVHVMTRRPSLGVSCLPQAGGGEMLALCQQVFGNDFAIDENPLVSTLNNTNAVSHVPMAVYNWTRIERAEPWPQYHYVTPHVAAVTEKVDRERMAVAAVFGWQLKSVQQKLAKSFGLGGQNLAEVAAELHQLRGGPAGPVDVQTRYLSEDVPFGLVFSLALGRIAGVAMPATEAMVAASNMILDRDCAAENDLVALLRLESESVEGLLARVRGG